MSADGQTTQTRILEAGKQEFLQNGFAGASLRTIAQKAGVTTGAIYGYYPDKEALFCALVDDTAEELYRRFLQSQQQFDSWEPEKKSASLGEYTSSAQEEILDFIYRHFDEARLIISCSIGTQYEGYVDRLVEIEERYTLRFAKSLREASRDVPDLSPDLVHIICGACYHGLFEVIAHNLPREEAEDHIRVLGDFYRAGWQKIFGLL